MVRPPAAPEERPVDRPRDGVVGRDPGHPDANEEGYVFLPNVNIVDEMANMISASRSYQGNVEVLNTSKQLMLATLKLGQ